MTHDPTRLLSDPNESETLRHFLRDEAHLPIPHGMDAAILAKLSEAPIPSTSTSTTITTAPWLKFIIVIGSGALVAFIAYRTTTRTSSTLLPMPSATQVSTVVASAAFPVAVPTVGVPVIPTAPLQRQEQAAPIAPQVIPTPLPSQGTGDLSREAALLNRARVSLRAGEPAVALATLATHAKEFPNGTLAQERAILEIQARKAAGQTDQARTQSEQFVREHPESPHAKVLKSEEGKAD